MSNKLLKFLEKKLSRKKKKKVDRQKIAKRVAKVLGPMGSIAKQKLKRDKALRDIMKGM